MPIQGRGKARGKGKAKPKAMGKRRKTASFDPSRGAECVAARAGCAQRGARKARKTEPEEKVDIIARFKNTNRTYLPAKTFQQWLQEEENQDKPTLVKFFNPSRGTFVFKRLMIVGPEGCEEKAQWVVENWENDMLQEDEDYV